MFKLLLILGVVSAALADDVQRPKVVYSAHTQFTSGTLDFSTSELKAFSGHAMNLIRAKCPSVDTKKIFQVQKYMGKLLAKKEPTPAKSKEFRPLLETMTTCAKEGKNDAPALQSEFLPFHSFRKVFIAKAQPIKEGAIPTGVDSGLKTADVPPPRVVSTTVFVRPKEETIRSSGGVFNWIHNIFSKVGSFFRNIFPFGHRSKRDVSEISEVSDISEDDSEYPTNAPGKDEPLPELSPYQVFTPARDDSNTDSVGKKAFGALIDQWCRIYCDSCHGVKQTHNFKLAAKQLLEDLFEEDSGIDGIAQQYLDKDFLDSIKKCE